MKFKRSSGLLVHPTSFPSPFGIGDLGLGAYTFIDFLKESKQALWQILPLGPTSFGDSPYQSFSTFAGNTLLISPELLVKEGYLSEADLVNTPDFAPTKIDYATVSTYKAELYKKAYRTFKVSASKEQKIAYNKFCIDNISWLEDYSLFVALKEYFIEQRRTEKDSNDYLAFKKTHKKILSANIIDDYYFGGVWSTWPTDLLNRKPEVLDKWKKALSEHTRYYKFLQYEFFRQWALLKAYANEADIKIIGDIPIFVAYDSADTWANPELFYLDSKGFPTEVAGVPPDYFSTTGQLWGNPLYNWEVHKSNHYKWWINRIESSLSLVDIVRIDHFRGFDEYWAIPAGEKTAVNGTWKKGPGKSLFEAIAKELGDLPIIAEDLGIITDSVRSLRDELGFPGMKILQFAFSCEDETRENAYLPHNLTQNAIIYSGTHDNDTTQGWYKTSEDCDLDIVRRYMNISGENIAWDFIRLAYSTVCDIAIVPLQDVMKLGSEARMNTPGVPAGNWQWRYTTQMLKDEYAEGLSYLADLFGR
jgi:4-alpha-glucanotransferase